jgi:hypothetical protein
MKIWSNEELNKIGTAEELQMASLRADGTLRSPVTMWVVRVGDDLYIRSVNGRDGKWFRGTQTRQAGHIQAGGVDKDVTFMDADSAIYDQVDTAYRSKYRRYSPNIVNSVLTPQSRLSTLRLLPR